MGSSLDELFKCQQCGKCCEQLGIPSPYPKDLEKMKDFFQISGEEIMSKYYGKIIQKNGKKMILTNDKKRKPCPFLDENKKCSIYNVRPTPCRKYPIKTDGGRVNVDCPAMEVIDNYPDEAFQE